MHVQVDPPPHVLEDEIGLRLATPDADWRRRPDMDPYATRGFRAAIVARARFIENLFAAQAEVDQPGPQAWKRHRLVELGYGIPDWLHLVPQASGTPFISFYTPSEMLALAREVGLKSVRHVSGNSLAERCFADRADSLRPSSGEDLLLATT
ncbi:hypothetical protein J4032_21210 [Streptomyces formicae]|uniref:Uncharacterized protein n=2 Tax=Streptomyces formicae TaxID=1616117 RepID=A0ABY3WPS4_9ACTN|nr:hypothetical protein J4032_21210 [Streptomyces formicae]